MKFIIDGDGTVSYSAAYDLLKDIVAPYIGQRVMTITSKTKGPLCENVNKVLNDLDTYHFIPHNYTTTIRNELDYQGEKVLIVVDAATRPDLVSYCWEHDIPVLDLTKALYPVKRN